MDSFNSKPLATGGKTDVHNKGAYNNVERAELTVNLDTPEGVGQLPVDILEKENEILITTPIAGVDLDKTDIIITDDVLTIKGERSPRLTEFGFEEKDYYTRECFWGKFQRSVMLPANVDANAIEAQQEDHVLYIRIPKKSQVTMRIVKIKTK